MDRIHYRKLIARLELDYGLSPRLFFVRTLWLAVVGHIVPLLMLLLPVAGIAFGFMLTRNDAPLLGGMLILILLPCLFFLIRLLWVPVDPPPGSLLSPEQAPRFFRLVEKMQARISGPKLHGIVIDDQCRVTVDIVPHMGALGGDHYYLVIGLPFLQALSANQFAAMLGREYSLIAVGSGYFNARLYRLWQHWLRLQAELTDPENVLQALPARFFRWFIPNLGAHCQVLLRRHAFDADQSAARFVSPSRTAHGLIRGILAERYLEERFWPGIFAATSQHPEPVNLPHAAMEQALNIPADDKAMRRWLKKALERRAATDEFEPALKARLAALNESPKVVAHSQPNAAQTLLGETLHELIIAQDAEWRASVIDAWRSQHEAVKAAQKTVAQMQGKPLDSLETPAMAQLATAFLTLGERELGLPLLLRACARTNAEVETLWHAAQELLRDDDVRALPLLDQVMQRDRSLLLEAAIQAMELCDLLTMSDRANSYRSLISELERA